MGFYADIFRGADDQWYWTKKDGENQEPVSHGEGYTRKDDAVTGCLHANPELTEADLRFLGDADEVVDVLQDDGPPREGL